MRNYCTLFVKLLSNRVAIHNLAAGDRESERRQRGSSATRNDEDLMKWATIFEAMEPDLFNNQTDRSSRRPLVAENEGEEEEAKEQHEQQQQQVRLDVIN